MYFSLFPFFFLFFFFGSAGILVQSLAPLQPFLPLFFKQGLIFMPKQIWAMMLLFMFPTWLGWQPCSQLLLVEMCSHELFAWAGLKSS
jgi:hypothetical protein